MAAGNAREGLGGAFAAGNAREGAGGALAAGNAREGVADALASGSVSVIDGPAPSTVSPSILPLVMTCHASRASPTRSKRDRAASIAVVTKCRSTR